MPNKQRIKELGARMPNNMAAYMDVKNYITYTGGGYCGETGTSYRYVNGHKISEADFSAKHELPKPFLIELKGKNPNGKQII